MILDLRGSGVRFRIFWLTRKPDERGWCWGVGGGLQRRPYSPGEATDSGVLKEGPRRQLYSARRPHPRDYLGREQGMPAEREKIVFNMDRFDPQHRSPDTCEELFEEPRGATDMSWSWNGCSSAGKAPRSTLPLGESGSAGHTMNQEGTR